MPESSPPLNADFLDILRALTEASAEFVVVGAHALAVHGVPRSTGDLDILVRPTSENAERVLEALRRFGAPLQAHGLTASDLGKPDNVYQIGLPPRRIDLLTGISGVSFEEARDSRVTHRVEDLELPFIGREALIRNKRATGRDRDLLDVHMLESTEPEP